MTEDVQATYEQFLNSYLNIVADDLVPKVALYDGLSKRFREDRHAFVAKIPLFFIFMQSLELDVFLTIAKLLENTRSDRNILKFLNYCETNRKRIHWKNGVIPNEVIKKHRAAIEAHETSITKITTRRDKFFAHLDKEYSLNREKLDTDYPIDMDAVIVVVRCLQRILGDHTMGLTNSGRVSTDGFFYIAVDNLLNQLMSTPQGAP